MKNILFFPSHHPIQYEEIAKKVCNLVPDVSVKFFLLNKPDSSFSFEYITYEELVNNIDHSEAISLNQNQNLNELLHADRIHKNNINKRDVLKRYLISLKTYLIKYEIRSVFGYALSDSITYGCYNLCKELGIKYYFLSACRIKNFYHLSSKIDGRGEFSQISNFTNDQILELVSEMTEKKIVPLYASDPTMIINKNLRNILDSAMQLIGSRIKLQNEYLDFYPPFLQAFKRFINRRFSNIELTNSVKNFSDFKYKKFIFYPLHLHPETATLIWGRWFNNQYEILKLFSRILPDDVYLLVKEHKVAVGRHKKGFYQKISRLPNTHIVDTDTNSHDLISHSQAVLSISGTAGFEAYCHSKPVILMGDVDYGCLPGITKATDFSQLRDLLTRVLSLNGKSEIDQYSLINFLKLKLDGSVPLENYTATSVNPKLIDAMSKLYIDKLK